MRVLTNSPTTNFVKELVTKKIHNQVKKYRRTSTQVKENVISAAEGEQRLDDNRKSREAGKQTVCCPACLLLLPYLLLPACLFLLLPHPLLQYLVLPCIPGAAATPVGAACIPAAAATPVAACHTSC